MEPVPEIADARIGEPRGGLGNESAHTNADGGIGDPVSSLAARADRAAAGRRAEVWQRFTAHAPRKPRSGRSAARVAIHANQVALVTLADPEDFLTLDRMVRAFGHERVAAIQGELDAVLGFGENLPIMTATFRALGDDEVLRERLVAAGVAPATATTVAATVYHHAFWLLMSCVGEVTEPPTIDSAEQLAEVVLHGNARQWLIELGPVTRNPWDPYGARLVELADQADLPVVARSLAHFRAIYQERRQRDERDTIAREIRRLVAISGLNQRDFARYIGTSASRLSTYATGKVTPSAAMLLRIQRAAMALRERSL